MTGFQLLPIEKFALSEYPGHRLALFSTGRIVMATGQKLPQSADIKSENFVNSAISRVKTVVISRDVIFLFVADEATTMVALRDAFAMVSEDDFQVMLAGIQLAQWSETHFFCPGCAAALSISATEMAKTCGNCQRNFYPQLSPAVIMLVHRPKKASKSNQREILLARGLPPRKFHGCLAGFVEPGETFEQTVAREVFEEVGIKIHNLKYFGSQPWPFPSQVMVGFLAEWKSGDIKIDPAEITEAGWYTAEHLPELPISKSIARKMIDHVVNGGAV